MTEPALTLRQAEAELQALDDLSRAEYGAPLQTLLETDDDFNFMRLVRLAGIQMKRPFAGPEDCPGYSGNLGAARAWIWDVDKLNDPGRQQTSEFQLLERVRTESGMDKGDLLAVAQEAGLMYVFGRWLHGKITDENAQSFVEVYHAEKSKELSLALNAADTILPVAGFLAGLTGVPALGVSLAILVAKYGFEKLTEPEPGPDA